MPSIATQVHWHETPTPLPPWQSDEQRAMTIALSRQLRDVAISPCGASTSGASFLVGNRARDLAKERMRLFMARRRMYHVGTARLQVEPLMSHRCVLNMLLTSLGAAPMSLTECTRTVQRVRGTLDQSDFPMVTCIHAIAASRGLEVRSLTREELKHRRCTFFPADMPPGKRVLLICSKIEPLFVGVFTEWLPRARRAGVSSKRGFNGAMRVMCPAHQPRPWHKRLQVLKQVDRNEAICLYMSTPDGADSFKAEDEARALAAATKKRGAAAGGAAKRGGQQKAVAGKRGGKKADASTADAAVDNLTSNNNKGDEASSDIDSVDLDLFAEEGFVDEDPSSSDDGGDGDYEGRIDKMSDAELLKLFGDLQGDGEWEDCADGEDGGPAPEGHLPHDGGLAPSDLVGAASVAAIAPIATTATINNAAQQHRLRAKRSSSCGGASPDGGSSSANGGRRGQQRALGYSGSSSSNAVVDTPLAPLQVEAHGGVSDPFALLPSASNVILNAVREATKNVQSRSTATWTQRMLKLRDRQLLYNLTQSQMAMME